MNMKKSKIVLALIGAWAVASTILHAQSSPPFQVSNSNVDFEFRSNGILIEKGYYTSSGTLTETGTGTRFFWYPANAALRAGVINTVTNIATTLTGTLTFTGVEWDDANIGSCSVALGTDTVASGSYSTALGKLCDATGVAAVSLGYGNSSTGDYSTTSGKSNNATGDYSVAIGYGNNAPGLQSAAFGASNSAIGSYSMAFGNGCMASANCATAFGLGNTASQLYATAFGHSTMAEGYFATAMGYNTDAVAEGSLVLGRYNVGLSSTGTMASATSWISGDPLFEIGNGTSTTAADALVVYKNGTITVQGPITMTNTGGDIPMFNGY